MKNRLFIDYKMKLKYTPLNMTHVLGQFAITVESTILKSVPSLTICSGADNIIYSVQKVYRHIKHFTPSHQVIKP